MRSCLSALLLLLLTCGTALAQGPDVYVNGTLLPDSTVRMQEEEVLISLNTASALLSLPEPIDGCWEGLDAEAADGLAEGEDFYVPLSFYAEAGLNTGDASCGSYRTVIVDNIVPRYDAPGLSGIFQIAHAAGAAADGTLYTNSLEAFQYNHLFGFSVFEFDLALSTDNVPVSVHVWKQFKTMCRLEEPSSGPLSSEEFLACRICGEYTPLTFSGIAALMAENPDVQVVLDAKRRDIPDYHRILYSAVRDEALAAGGDVIDRVIPYVYDEDMAAELQEIWPWKQVIYALYILPDGVNLWDAFLSGYRNGFRVFADWSYELDDRMLSLVKAAGLSMFAFTVDDRDEYAALRDTGAVAGVVTNFLGPYSMDED